MRIPDYLESFRCSAAALILLLPDEVEARQGQMPAGAFFWRFEGLPRSAVVDPAKDFAALCSWADQCGDLGILPLLIVCDGDALDDEQLDELDGLGVELLYATAENAAELDRDEPSCLPLGQRLMLPDEAVYVRYLLLSCGHSLSVWPACGSLKFWLHYGLALSKWGRVESGQRWRGLLLESMFLEARRREPVQLAAGQLQRYSEGDDLTELLGSDARLRAVEICKAMPFLRNEYRHGLGEPLQIGRIPGLDVTFDGARETAYQEHFGHLLNELLNYLRPRAQLNEVGSVRTAEELGLFVVEDSAGLLQPGDEIGAACFEPERLLLRLPGLPLTDPTLFRVTLDGLSVGELPLSTAVDLDPEQHAYLGRVDVKLSFPGGSYERATDAAQLRRVIVHANDRRIACELGL
jgi:hypothetical protein